MASYGLGEYQAQRWMDRFPASVRGLSSGQNTRTPSGSRPFSCPHQRKPDTRHHEVDCVSFSAARTALSAARSPIWRKRGTRKSGLETNPENEARSALLARLW